jgi:hypothetical protein
MSAFRTRRLEQNDGERLYFAASMYYCTDRETWWSDTAAAAESGLQTYLMRKQDQNGRS